MLQTERKFKQKLQERLELEAKEEDEQQQQNKSLASESDTESSPKPKRRKSKQRDKLPANAKTFNTLRSFPTAAEVLPGMEVMGTAKAYYQQIRDDWDQERSRKILEIDAVGQSESLFSENMQASFEASRALTASSAPRDDIESDDDEVVLLDDNHEVLDVTLGEDTAVVESKRSGAKSATPHSIEMSTVVIFSCLPLSGIKRSVRNFGLDPESVQSQQEDLAVAIQQALG